MKKVIIDGDFGGDEMQLMAVLLAHPSKFKILGTTAVFGNTGHDQVLENAGSLLRLFNAEKIPRYAGAKQPSDRTLPEGDDAHGADGIGGVALEKSTVAPAQSHAVDFILDQLKQNPEHEITITATGPLTNIALAFEKDASTMKRVKEIIVMGGCTEDLQAHDMPLRRGNITPRAEFNFYMAPKDANTVMTSDLPLVLLPMNCTQQMSFTPERQEKLRKVFSNNAETGEQVIAMMRAAEWLDKMKFDSDNFMHDVHTALYLLDPSQYTGQRGTVVVDSGTGDFKGHCHFVPGHSGIVVMNKIVNPAHSFDLVSQSFQKTLALTP